MIIQIIILKILLIFQLVSSMNIEEIKEGNCYTYTTDKNNTFGLVTLGKEYKGKNVSSIRFAIIYFKDGKVTSIEKFKTGELYTHNVYEGLKGDYKMGIQCYDFYSKGFHFLDKFKYLGNVSLDKGSFTIGGGGGFTNELFFNISLNIMDQASIDYKKESLTKIIE